MDPARNAEIQHAMQRGRVPIRCVDGPYAGQSTKMANPPATLKLTVPVNADEEEEDGPKVTHIYKRKNTRAGVEYRFKETVPE